MARDFKLSFRFGSGVLGASGGNVALPGTNLTAFTASFAGLTGTAATANNAVSGQLISCPLAWGGYTQTGAGLLAPYAEDVPNNGAVLPGHTSRNDLFAIVDAVSVTTLTAAQSFVVQASDDLTNWVTVGTGDVTLSGANPSNGTVACTIAAATYPVLTASATHNLQPGDLLVVTTATTVNFNNNHESVAAVAGNVVEVATVPSSTTFSIKYPGPIGTTLKSNMFPLANLTVVATGTPALTFTRCATSGTSLGSQIMIPIAPTARPYVRLAAFGAGGATGFGVIRDAYIATARTGVAR
jgi:hypothetical protein